AETCIFNRDDEISSRLAAEFPGAVSFGLNPPRREQDFGVIETRDGAWLSRGARPLIRTDELRITGAHNHANALACLALGEAVGLPFDAMVATLREFSGLPHRMAPVTEHAGVVYVNDSKGTNVGATIAAIRGAGRMLVLIAGGDGKGQDFSQLAEALRGKARHVVLIGKDAAAISDAIAGEISVTRANDMASAVRFAASVAQPGDMVLLSPACSSLDMFANYEARGDAFVRAVHEVAA
ncbi:MAG: UDP-N-acetylmuramoyl-L-alanine--D-glutamate ligase, partial [Proteobacteria bacterium]|nr:UDP-N-acetylmuramoyl-L-alanine--D-glutamate ligase [Pseudomonadota bacterium]